MKKKQSSACSALYHFVNRILLCNLILSSFLHTSSQESHSFIHSSHSFIHLFSHSIHQSFDSRHVIAQPKFLFLCFIKPISLGLLRSDIMLESICAEDCSCPRSYCCWKQVEINTIASGFGHLGPISKELQRSYKNRKYFCFEIFFCFFFFVFKLFIVASHFFHSFFVWNIFIIMNAIICEMSVFSTINFI